MSAAEYDTLLFAAHAKALTKLSELLDATDDPREIRLIATSILRLRPIGPTAAEAAARPTASPNISPAPEPQASTPLQPPPGSPAAPLTPAELAELASYLPHVPVSRFTRKHTPAYWREALALQRRRGQPVPASAAA